MKIAIVPASVMKQQLSLWALEREVDAAGRRLNNCIKGVEAARTALLNRQQELFNQQQEIENARVNINHILKRNPPIL